MVEFDDNWVREEPYDPPQPTDAELAEHDAQVERIDYETQFALDVTREARRIKVRDAAQRQITREREGTLQRPKFVTLSDFLAVPDTDPTYRIGALWPTGGRVVLAAQWKAGKSTMIGNLVRSLADDQPFLDRFQVEHHHARVALIDDELDERTLRRWLDDQGVYRQDRVQLVALRGSVATFDILDADIRAEWARDLAALDVDIVLLDCLRPILDALGLDENHEAGRFLVAFDSLLAEAGVSEALVVHHMGHVAERSRGDSRIMDWPDALWTLVRDRDDDDSSQDDPAGARYFSAYGRDVEYPQVELTYHPSTRRLSIGNLAPNRRQATEQRRTTKAMQTVLTAVERSPGIGKTRLRKACRSLGVNHNPDIDEAVDLLLEDRKLTRRQVGQRHEHYLPEHSPNGTVPNVPNHAHGHGGHTTVPVPFIEGTVVVPPSGTDHDADESGHGLVLTKPCPEGCGTEIPEHHVRCASCASRIRDEVRNAG